MSDPSFKLPDFRAMFPVLTPNSPLEVLPIGSCPLTDDQGRPSIFHMTRDNLYVMNPDHVETFTRLVTSCGLNVIIHTPESFAARERDRLSHKIAYILNRGRPTLGRDQ